MENFSFVLSAAQLSDLFFNHENIALAELDNPTPEETQEALRKDATAFSDILNWHVSPEWFIKSYNDRV